MRRSLELQHFAIGVNGVTTGHLSVRSKTASWQTAQRIEALFARYYGRPDLKARPFAQPMPPAPTTLH